MPSSSLSRLRRPVGVVCALVAILLGLLLGPAPTVGAVPYAAGSRPELRLPTDVTFVRGQPGEAYLIEADGDPVPAVGVDRLPAGLKLVAHADGSATLSGTPSGPPGPSTVEVRAQSAVGSTVESLTVTIQQVPAFVGRGPVVLAGGVYGAVLIRTVGYPAPSIGLEGDLPAGVTFVDNGDGTATIAGAPVSGPASAPVTLTAVNVVADTSLTTSVRVVRPDPVAVPVMSTSSPLVTPHSTAPRREP